MSIDQPSLTGRTRFADRERRNARTAKVKVKASDTKQEPDARRHDSVQATGRQGIAAQATFVQVEGEVVMGLRKLVKGAAKKANETAKDVKQVAALGVALTNPKSYYNVATGKKTPKRYSRAGTGKEGEYLKPAKRNPKALADSHRGKMHQRSRKAFPSTGKTERTGNA